MEIRFLFLLLDLKVQQNQDLNNSYMKKMWHLGLVRFERIDMNIWKIYAQIHPKELLIIETDKQNSNTTIFPYFHRIPKNGEQITRLPINLQSVIHNGCKWKSWILLPIHSRHANISITLRFNDLLHHSLSHQKLPSIIRRMYNDF